MEWTTKPKSELGHDKDFIFLCAVSFSSSLQLLMPKMPDHMYNLE